MGYTSDATMDERGLRDVERWKDKIEVRLDNRQVFVLFFGSALVACLLFILGVIVGKRLESRGRAVAPEIEDPLALLDKVASSPRPEEGLTFPKALFGGGAAKTAVETSPRPVKLPTPEPVRPARAAVPEPMAPASRPAAPAPRAAALVTPTARKPELAGKEQPAKLADPKTDPGTVATKAATPGKPVAVGEAAKPKGRFTLQLSSFQDRDEAAAFAKRFASERPYVVVSDIPGKGTWYRVRVGDFATAKDALAAKSNFEKKHSVIALVAPASPR